MNNMTIEQANAIIEKATQPMPPATVFDLQGVFGWSSGIVVAAIILWQVISKVRKNSAQDGAETKLYDNLGHENDRLIERIRKLEETKDSCNSELQAVKAQLTQINIIEMENVHLRERINEKDRELERRNQQVEDMIARLSDREKTILELTNRVHTLELRLATDQQKFCADCPRLAGQL